MVQHVAAQGFSPTRRNGEVLAPRRNALFPQICPKCGETGSVQQKLWLMYPSLGHQLLMTKWSARKARCVVSITPWLCIGCAERVSFGYLMAKLTAVLALMSFVGGVAMHNVALKIFSLVVIIVGTIVATRYSAVVGNSFIDDEVIVLTKLHDNFVSSLPEANW
jgi:hypothetical protein